MATHTQHTPQTDTIDPRVTSAQSLVKTQGILSIIFGSIGVLVSAVFVAALVVSDTSDAPSNVDGTTALGIVILTLFAFVLWTAPHIYLIISGYFLTHTPTPKVVKGLTITNLIVGVCWNLVLFIFAIITLTQLSEYERGNTDSRRI